MRRLCPPPIKTMPSRRRSSPRCCCNVPRLLPVRCFQQGTTTMTTAPGSLPRPSRRDGFGAACGGGSGARRWRQSTGRCWTCDGSPAASFPKFPLYITRTRLPSGC
ncbi:hypothetical protein BU14_1367s0001 [Porphyra umbilicalis]|uniref:Uncharacterized protein n=1 Tax=Porphyra umbilicalis TaxID=2786 RepID=A0A1X6NLX7_PORUM|nr:hypothetical protein BU14_1367s0001 [Porphyra umbilicalis]|eukprot:OSX69587.1 hypothetical protein BU14_1367s0001 [Porphyra umbilicalis]